MFFELLNIFKLQKSQFLAIISILFSLKLTDLLSTPYLSSYISAELLADFCSEAGWKVLQGARSTGLKPRGIPGISALHCSPSASESSIRPVSLNFFQISAFKAMNKPKNPHVSSSRIFFQKCSSALIL